MPSLAKNEMRTAYQGAKVSKLPSSLWVWLMVQRQSGGVELNAMFIDEGFGTQSPDALDKVLDTLTGLQSTGRLVGFISHVEELKDRIPAQLHVHKTPTGSRVELKVR